MLVMTRLLVRVRRYIHTYLPTYMQAIIEWEAIDMNMLGPPDNGLVLSSLPYLPTYLPTYLQAIIEWEAIDMNMLGSPDNGLKIRTHENKEYFFQVCSLHLPTYLPTYIARCRLMVHVYVCMHVCMYVCMYVCRSVMPRMSSM